MSRSLPPSPSVRRRPVRHPARHRVPSIVGRVGRLLKGEEEGAATAEYAVATMAAVGFAGLLVVILRSDEVREMLTELVRNALTFTG